MVLPDDDDILKKKSFRNIREGLIALSSLLAKYEYHMSNSVITKGYPKDRLEGYKPKNSRMFKEVC